MATDHVDRLLDQWAAVRPELDTRSLRLSARIVRLQRILDRGVADVLARFGVNEGEINVLATLRRAGPPYELTPTELYRGLLLSSSAMTNRIDRLEERGLVLRIPDVDDGRKVRVALTDAGRDLVDAAMDVHVAHLADELGFLDDDDHGRLEDLLRTILARLEAQGDDR
jgi:DNA-binding MarR family transcriptional regulator